MIKYVKHYHIKKDLWDRCIGASDNPLIYALSWYLDIVSPNWDALIMDNYTAVMPLTWKKKFGIKYLIQPYFSQQLGVFGEKQILAEVDEFLKKIPSKFILIRINLNRLNSFNRSDFNVLDRTNFELDLNDDYHSIHEKFATSTKKNIKDSNKKKLTVVEINDTDLFIDFSKGILNKKIALPNAYYITLKKLSNILNQMNSVRLFGIYKDETLCASVMMIKSYKRWIYQISVSNKSGLKNMAMFFFLDRFIQEHANTDFILDFEGSDIEGIANFYANFGARKTTYPHIRNSRIPFIG
ncbi:MAG: hypothetical protein JW894_05285 [Bacteroidales bacterium]|nr:hypothetical protein [Bacteroidales bacterium]